MIEIPVLTILKHFIMVLISYGSSWLLYRLVIHPEYRWHQEGNECYDDAKNFMIACGSVLLIIIEIGFNVGFKFILK